MSNQSDLTKFRSAIFWDTQQKQQESSSYYLALLMIYIPDMASTAATAYFK